MSLSVAAKFARRELRGGVAGFRIFLLCLTFGVAAIAAIGTVRSSIQAGLEREGAALLGGDAEIELTYRFATEDEWAWMLREAVRISEIAEFRSMAVVEREEVTERGLTQIKAVDTAYPLVGAVALEPPMRLDQALTNDGTVMERVLADRLGLQVGDRYRLGEKEFTLSAILTREPDNGGNGFGFGPRIIVYRTALEGSGLLQPGTLFSSHYRLDFPEGAVLADLKRQARKSFENSGMRWRDSRAGAPGVAEFVDRLSAFLILVGLAGLAVGGVGVSSAVRAYLAGKTGVIATLRTLGADRRTIFQTYFLQIGVLGLLGIVMGLALGTVLPLLASPIISSILPIPAEFGIYAKPLLEAAAYGVLTALIFTLWPLSRTGEIRAATLFRDALTAGSLLPPRGFLAVIALLVASMTGAAAAFAGTVWLTLWTAAGVLGALILLSVAAVGVRWFARTLSPVARGNLPFRAALDAISKPGSEISAVMLSIGLGLSVLSAVGQVDGNIRAAISDELPEVAPSYFFVDIQSSQMPEFRQRLDSDPSVSKYEAAPMLRGVITEINGQPAKKAANNHWVVQGDRGITYSDAKPDNTTVTAGDWWPEGYSGEPLVSFSATEAEEMGLQLGDTITINVLGLDITATITSFREVDFSNAGMGFILSMNPSALQGAPHSFISTVYAEEEAEARILRDLANAFPNITAIRIRDAIEQASNILSNIAAATAYGAGITLLTGVFVLIGAVAAGERARNYEAAILKTLGASRRQILISFALRSALTGLVAGLIALLVGMTAAWAVSTFVFETEFRVIWSAALGIIGSGVALTLIAGMIFSARSLGVSPARVLRARE